MAYYLSTVTGNVPGTQSNYRGCGGSTKVGLAKVDVTPGEVLTITVGAAGTAGAYVNVSESQFNDYCLGGNGGDTSVSGSFGTLTSTGGISVSREQASLGTCNCTPIGVLQGGNNYATALVDPVGTTYDPPEYVSEPGATGFVYIMW